MARGTQHPETTRVEAVRRVVVLGLSKPSVALDLNVSRTQVYRWCDNVNLVEKAKALGAAPAERRWAIDQGPDEPDEPAAYSVELTDADPLDPGPVTLAALQAAYRLTDDLETLDDIAGWPRGTCSVWFEDAEGGDDVTRLPELLDAVEPRQSHDVVRAMRRARAIADLDLIAKVVAGGSGWRAASQLLEARRPGEFGERAGEDDDDVDGLAHLDEAGLEAISGVKVAP